MTKGTGGMDVEELLEALAVLEVLGPRSTDLAEKNEKTPDSAKNRLLDRLNKELPRVKRKKVKKKKHWKTKQRERREEKTRWFSGRRQRINQEWALRLAKGDVEDIYRWVSKARGDARVKYQRPEWEITLEEFTEFVYPVLDGAIPVVKRYDAKAPWTLGNTLWLEPEEKRVLFDGKDYLLKSNGFCL